MTAQGATREAFLADVIAHPDDDTPRLVFADWLEEHGEEERAEFIRLQCRLAEIEREVGRKQFFHGLLMERDRDRLQLRERKLQNDHGHDFAGSAGPYIPVGRDRLSSFRRGFVEAVTLPAADWLAHADALTRAHPIREVRLTTWPDVSRHFGLAKFVARKMKPVYTDNANVVEVLLKDQWSAITFALPPP